MKRIFLITLLMAFAFMANATVSIGIGGSGTIVSPGVGVIVSPGKIGVMVSAGVIGVTVSVGTGFGAGSGSGIGYFLHALANANNAASVKTFCLLFMFYPFVLHKIYKTIGFCQYVTAIYSPTLSS